MELTHDQMVNKIAKLSEDNRVLTARLKAENERLKEENKELCERMATVTYRATGGRLSYSNYTLDAIERAFYDQLDILSDRKIEPYKQTLQEIKAIAKECTTCGDCFNCKYTEHCSTDIEAQALGVCRMILKLISKAEEE